MRAEAGTQEEAPGGGRGEAQPSRRGEPGTGVGHLETTRNRGGWRCHAPWQA